MLINKMKQSHPQDAEPEIDSVLVHLLSLPTPLITQHSAKTARYYVRGKG